MMSNRIIYSIGIILFLVLSPFTNVSANIQKSWHFKVLLDNEGIGHHSFKLQERDNKTHVSVEADFDVKFLFFSAYSYKHKNHEIWRGRCLDSIASNTNDNGDLFFLRGNNLGNAIHVETVEGTSQYKGCIKTFSYWDPDFLNSNNLLNAQTGKLVAVNIEHMGVETIKVLGNQVDANHYRLVSDEFTIDLWYSLDNQDWLALKSTTREGAVLQYKRI